MFSKQDPTQPIIEDDEIDVEMAVIDSNGYSAGSDNEVTGISPKAPKQKRLKQTVHRLPQALTVAAVQEVKSPESRNRPPAHPGSPSVQGHLLLSARPSKPAKPILDLYSDRTKVRANLLLFSSNTDTTATTDIFVDNTESLSSTARKKPS
jgi:hypothetical protein